MDNDEYITLFQCIGQSSNINETVIQTAEKFVPQLHGQVNCSSVNEARYTLFRLSYKTDTGLPPNRDSLICHIKRADYQACIHRHSLVNNNNAPSTAEHGCNCIL